MTEDELSRFKTSLLRIITNRPIKELSPLKLLVYLNPNAGSNSQKHFNAMEQFLSHTNFSFDVVRTTHRGHCQEHIATVDTGAYEAVIIISGDGLMH
jgi:diacylglycerol kinase family enzyme